MLLSCDAACRQKEPRNQGSQRHQADDDERTHVG
jgi:hypothetical protein